MARAGRKPFDEEVLLQTQALVKFFVPTIDDTDAKVMDIRQAMGYAKKSKGTYYRYAKAVQELGDFDTQTQYLSDHLTVSQFRQLVALDKQVNHGLPVKGERKYERHVRDDQDAKNAKAKAEALSHTQTNEHTAPLVAKPDRHQTQQRAKETGMARPERPERKHYARPERTERPQQDRPSSYRPKYERRSNSAGHRFDLGGKD